MNDYDRLATINVGSRFGPRTASVRVRSRWDDCDRYGHVNNAAYRGAHDRAGMPSGELRAVEITYRQSIPPEVVVDIDVAILKEGASYLRIAYALGVDGRPIADDLPPIGRDAGGQPFRFRQAVRSYELGPDGAARPQAILQWLEHAVLRAALRARWPPASACSRRRS